MFRKLAGVYVWVLLCLPFMAHAHATPTLYTPAASETVLETPELISIQFTERIEKDASSLSVYGPSGNAVGEGKGTVHDDDERVLSIPIQDEGEGVYTVSWQVVSVDDGHFTKGAYSFLVNSEGLAYEGEDETVSVAYSTSLQDGLVSFFNLAGESIFIALFFLALGLVLFKKELVRHALYVHVSLLSLLLFCIGAGASFLKKSHELAELQGVPLGNAISIYAHSSAGMAGLMKIVLACLFVALFIIPLKRFSWIWNAILFLLLCGILFVQSLISHAAASLFMPHLSIGVTFVHLFAKEFVIGGVLVLCVLFFMFLVQKRLHEYIGIARLYDVAASCALLCAALTGVYITWLHLKTPANLFYTSWGELFIVLLSFTMILGVLRLFHQFVVHAHWDKKKLRSVYAATLPVEVVIALIVLFYSGFISMTTPPFTVESYTFEERAVHEEVETRLAIHPYESSMFLVSFTDSTSGAALDPQALTIFTEQTTLGIGPNVMEPIKRYEGGYVFPKAELSPAGDWTIHVSASFNDRYDAQSAFTLTYPDDIEQTRFSNTTRVWDDFALLMLCIALGATFVFSALIFLAYRAWKKKEVQEEVLSLTYTWKSLSLTLVLIAFLVGCVLMLSQSSFEHACKKAGFVWQMGYPTRDFEATSKNALLGCTVHEGHYHFIDEGEFNAYLMEEK